MCLPSAFRSGPTEFVARAVVAPDIWRFFKKNWWQIVFLVLLGLRILRLVPAFRVLRTGRVLSSAVRSSRSARKVPGVRVGRLAVVSATTILGSSQLLYEFGIYESYADALHGAALSAVTEELLARVDPFAKGLEVALAVFSVIVFAGLAGTLGAYFLETRQRGEAATPGS